MAERAPDWRPRLYVMVGIPGSGKTTYARRRLAHALRISLDDLRVMLTNRTFDPQREPAVAVAGEAVLRAVLANARVWGADVVFDATNVTRAWRRRSLQAAEAAGASAVAVYVDCPLGVALARNRGRRHPVPEDVIERFQTQLEPPDLAEGFADVLVVREAAR